MDKNILIGEVLKAAKYVAGSVVFVMIIKKDYITGAYSAMQLGMAVMMGKRIRLLVHEGMEISDHFKAVTERIEYFKGADDIQLGMDRLLDDLKQELAQKPPDLCRSCNGSGSIGNPPVLCITCKGSGKA